MAYYHLHTKPISRSSGSAVAAAAYRARAVLRDEASGELYHFDDRTDLLHSEIVLPHGAPAELLDRGRLWNASEAAERRWDARTAREIRVALVPELSDERNIELARRFAREHIVDRYGTAADINIHKPSQGNIHAHILVTDRQVDLAGLGRKVREMNARSALLEWRAQYAACMNQALEQEAIAERVDHRSLKDQLDEALTRGDFEAARRLDRLPKPYISRRDLEKERRGIASPGGARRRAVEVKNAETRKAWDTVAKFGEHARAAFMGLRRRLGSAVKALEAWKERIVEWAREVRHTGSENERTESMALKKQDVHNLYGTAGTRAEDEAWKIATTRSRSFGRLETGTEQWAMRRRVVEEAKRNGFVNERHPRGYSYDGDVRLRKGDHVIELAFHQGDSGYHEYMYANLKRDEARTINAMQAIEIVRAVGQSEREAQCQAEPLTDFQRRLAEVRARQEAKSEEKETAPESDFQRRLNEIRERQAAQAQRLSASQKM